MSGNLEYGDLVAKIALNSKLTAHEVEEALEVLSAVVQESLQGGGSVDLLGLGRFQSESGAVVFAAGESLTDAVSDPAVKIQIERSPGMLPSTLYDVTPAKHRVNVC